MRIFLATLCVSLVAPLSVAQTQSSTVTAEPSASCQKFFGATPILDDSISLKKPTPIGVKDRQEIMTSRACMISFWPNGIGEEHGQDVNADQMRILRDAVEAYSKGETETVLTFQKDSHDLLKLHKDSLADEMQAHLRVLAKHYQLDVPQHLLFGDLMLLKKLIEENRFQEANSEGLRIIKVRTLRAKAVPWTNADEATYISSDNLANFIILATAVAHSQIPVKTPPDELRFLVNYLDSRPQLVNVLGRFQWLPDTATELMQRVSDKSWYHFDQPSWTRSEQLAKLPFVLGATEYDTGFLLLLEGKHVYALNVQDDKPTQLLTGSSAASAYNRSLSADLSANSTADTQLFGVSRFGTSYEINVGGKTTVSVTTQEMAALKTGTPLPADHPLTKLVKDSTDSTLVLYTNPLMLKDANQRQASDDMAFALSKAYPEAQIVRDPFSDKTKEQVKKLRELGVSGSAKTIAVVAEDSFGVKDYKLVQNLEEELRAKNIDVVPVSKASVQWTQAGGKLVLVITGHIDTKLAGFVRALGKAGVFQDNYVVFNSCRAKLSRQLATEMTTEYNANAVFVYDSLITPEALEPILTGLPASVEQNSDRPFWQVWRETVRQHKLNGIWTVCEDLFRYIAEPA